MSKQLLAELMADAVLQLQHSNDLPQSIPDYQITPTQDKKNGDFACNIALVLAKSAKRSPRELADLIIKALPTSNIIKKIEIAGPGFINFYLKEEALYQVLQDILAKGHQFGHSTQGQDKKIIIEFVSANPTGPLHVGHGRHAAYGAVVANLLAAIGFNVHREYYVNDAGRQMDILAASTWIRYLALCGVLLPFPTNAYKGEYVIDIARNLYGSHDKAFAFDAGKILQGLPLDEPAGGDKEHYIDAIIERAKSLLGKAAYKTVFDCALNTILKDIHDDLAEFGVTYERWFSEREFIQSDVVEKNIKALQEKNELYEQEGALWFRSTQYGDEKDRVLQRSNGQRTYFANDFAYHINKFERGFEHAIDIFGADHHGYVPRMKAGLSARGISPNQLDYLLVQFVMLYRNAQPVQMSTRSGSFVTLRELREEVGNDAARFFYVMRKCEQHVDFDLDLAKSQSNENPVYYIQYAYARICSVFRQLAEKSLDFDPSALQYLPLLVEPEELDLLGMLRRYPDTLQNAAEQYAPHQLTHYLRELASIFHIYYNKHQFLVEDASLRHARLILITATRQVLANGLQLLGVSTPENM